MATADSPTSLITDPGECAVTFDNLKEWDIVLDRYSFKPALAKGQWKIPIPIPSKPTVRARPRT